MPRECITNGREKAIENRRTQDLEPTTSTGKHHVRQRSDLTSVDKPSSSFFRKDPTINRLQWSQKTLPQESPGKRQRIIEEDEEEEEEEDLAYREKRNRKRI
ncbi:Hypothetical predicted protein [Pelobates cultripes]|uniref:Uncharacterized protein n=1 Tax=Pelobates cultripes TaxID=61616 RepID=A0AAD1VTY9_PELCU|nr:Hypothetical predicted protein [Pelobates cultripes]